MRLKGWLGAIVAIALFVSAPSMVTAQTVKLTKHDLSNGTIVGVTNYNQVCAYCHAPHNTAANTPLWNRAFGTGAYTMYTSTNSATMSMTVGANPGPVSKACLSCHDGTIGLDVITNFPAGAAGPTGTKKITGSESMGTDLSNDHPIAVTYDITKDAAYNPIVLGKVGVLPLYGAGKDQVECGTCHNVHDNTTAPFLRMSNTGSLMCLACHKK
jgi:predicted CXXCH cytochrome family protein